ncbi:hypothetical protein L1987_51234 [Smallanthus sonchifolius]|uniref:Uncharacterized protein n=1 Tax=Smallanthus sonchifolius TaxID=185202 RepID=A0ACB9EQE8_9ASTR|nr:hypothetical protein L1987_51234 [Smallanthus sonchifolius]
MNEKFERLVFHLNEYLPDKLSVIRDTSYVWGIPDTVPTGTKRYGSFWNEAIWFLRERDDVVPLGMRWYGTFKNLIVGIIRDGMIHSRTASYGPSRTNAPWTAYEVYTMIQIVERRSIVTVQMAR